MRKSRVGRPPNKRSELPPGARCPFCDAALEDDIVHLGENALETVKKASDVRDGGAIAKIFEETGCSAVHKRCRAKYINKKELDAIKKSKEKAEAADLQEGQCGRGRALRSTSTQFDPRTQCILCGKSAESVDSEGVLHQVSTIDAFRCAVLRRAAKRADKWGGEVKGRVGQIFADLVAAEAFYHKSCNVRYFGGLQKENKNSAGRAPEVDKALAFDSLCNHLVTTNECQFSLNRLVEKMKEFSPTGEVYSRHHLKYRLEEHFKEEVIITDIPGEDAIVNLRCVANKILFNTWRKNKHSAEENARLEAVRAAAVIVKQDIQSFVFHMDNYPPLENILEDNFVPETLKLFLDTVITSQSATCKQIVRKKSFFGQSIVTACRPKSYISPIMLCHGLYLQRKIGSKEAVDLAYALGVSVSYNETLRYVQNYVKMPSSIDADPGNFYQFVFDNADVNVCTLDGHNTFHSLGGCKISTPGSVTPARSVPRLKLEKSQDIALTNRIEMVEYNKAFSTGLKQIVVKPLALSTAVPPNVVKALTLDFLWLAGSWAEVPRSPSWAGYMSACLRPTGSFVATSSVTPVPFINLDPGNLETLYSALLFALKVCKKLKQLICFVTFDQPLYLKSRDIVEASLELKGVIVRLGGFHLLMSFMGSIGSIMEESGLADLWAQVYAPASVPAMLGGKAYARALRALLLTQTALGMLLLEKSTFHAKAEISALHIQVLQGAPPDEAVATQIAVALYDAITATGEQAALESRTAMLWWQFFQMVTHIRTFIRAERTGDWGLHLYSIQRMLPFFHAAAHINYAKTAHLYLQDMSDLNQKMNTEESEEFTKFTCEGYFTIRRSEAYWGGVWSDMIIEQVLNLNLNLNLCGP
ncbi:hypothetical protein FOCC_FOCC003457 [Frankliniella occidentalis]|nr:hypothetical protein FOCC_FOCC003457 [Frankliniella occidentalis]